MVLPAAAALVADFEAERAASGAGSTAALPMPHTRSSLFVSSVRDFDFPGLLQTKEKGQALLFDCSCRAALQRTVFATS